MYYSLRKICSYNYHINAIIGARGTGKTYALKNYVIKKYLNENKKFIWLRDTEEACEKLRNDRGNKFFNDIRKKFPQLKTGLINGEIISINGKQCGYLMPISTYYKYKGNSYEDIETIVFDEFLPEKCQQFTANRVRQFINAIDTITRTRNNVKVFMLANALDIGNEIFDIFDIKIKGFGFYKNKSKGVILHYSENDTLFNEMRSNSIVGKLIKNTIYDDEIIHGVFNDDSELYYDKKPPKCRLFCIFNGLSTNVRIYTKDDMFYVCRDYGKDSYLDKRYVKSVKEMLSYTKLANNDMIKYFRKNLSENKIKFENSNVYNNFIDFLS